MNEVIRLLKSQSENFNETKITDEQVQQKLSFNYC